MTSLVFSSGDAGRGGPVPELSPRVLAAPLTNSELLVNGLREEGRGRSSVQAYGRPRSKMRS